MVYNLLILIYEMIKKQDEKYEKIEILKQTEKEIRKWR